MAQPKKKGVIGERYKRKTSSVNKTAPINKERGGEDVKVHKKRVYQQKSPKAHPEYGTSKLEEKFAKNFLDKLGVKYIYQYKMESIGRFLDFMCIYERVAIEIDGDYYHSYGLVYEEMSPMQKKNYRVDKEKDHWCLINGIQMIRIWEHDINEHPENVMKMLKEKLGIAKDEQNKKNEKKKRH